MKLPILKPMITIRGINIFNINDLLHSVYPDQQTKILSEWCSKNSAVYYCQSIDSESFNNAVEYAISKKIINVIVED